METNRAIRHLRSDSVPDELVSKLIHAATRAADHLVDSLGDVPVRIFVWSTLHPATQNLLLAERPIREPLGIADPVKVVAMIPVGWPARPFGLAKRKAIDQVIHREKW